MTPRFSSVSECSRTERVVDRVNRARASWPGHASALDCQCAAIAMNSDQGPFGSSRKVRLRELSSTRASPKRSRKRYRSRSGNTSSPAVPPGTAEPSSSAAPGDEGSTASLLAGCVDASPGKLGSVCASCPTPVSRDCQLRNACRWRRPLRDIKQRGRALVIAGVHSELDSQVQSVVRNCRRACRGSIRTGARPALFRSPCLFVTNQLVALQNTVDRAAAGPGMDTAQRGALTRITLIRTRLRSRRSQVRLLRGAPMIPVGYVRALENP
jgi:hypothetical protein